MIFVEKVSLCMSKGHLYHLFLLAAEQFIQNNNLDYDKKYCNLFPPNTSRHVFFNDEFLKEKADQIICFLKDIYTLSDEVLFYQVGFFFGKTAYRSVISEKIWNYTSLVKKISEINSRLFQLPDNFIRVVDSNEGGFLVYVKTKFKYFIEFIKGILFGLASAFNVICVIFDVLDQDFPVDLYETLQVTLLV